MTAVFWLIDTVLGLVFWAVIAWVVLSWLFAFNVVNPRNQFVAAVANFLENLTNPLLRPIRRVLPNLGAIDISPIVLLLGITFLQIFLRTTVAPMFGVFGF